MCVLVLYSVNLIEEKIFKMTNQELAAAVYANTTVRCGGMLDCIYRAGVMSEGCQRHIAATKERVASIAVRCAERRDGEDEESYVARRAQIETASAEPRIEQTSRCPDWEQDIFVSYSVYDPKSRARIREFLRQNYPNFQDREKYITRAAAEATKRLDSSQYAILGFIED